MNHTRIAHAIAAALCASSMAAGPLHASRTMVPDDHPTIQQAMDSGADTVLVRAGTYAEDLVTTSDVVLLAFDPWNTPVQGVPIVSGFEAGHSAIVHGLRFTGPVTIATGDWGQRYRFEGCRFDAGVTTATPFSAFLYARGCLFLADLEVAPYTGQYLHNTFAGARLDAAYEGSASYIGNVFMGPGAYGLRTYGHHGGVTISGNIVSGRGDGIIVAAPVGTVVTDNVVEDCTGTAFSLQYHLGSGFGTATVHDNTVARCGGHGFELITVIVRLERNRIHNVGGDGIRATGSVIDRATGNDIREAGGSGIVSDGPAARVSCNTILRVLGDGISVQSVGYADSNVIGRAGGGGLRIHESYGASIHHNTIFLCATDAIAVESSVTDSISHNIAYANGGAGFAFSGTGTPALSCNDWHGNTGGATSGAAPGLTDLDLDPLFCDLADDDVRLSTVSPVLDAPGCGRIGALGEGCATGAPVPPGSGEGHDGLWIIPRPARGHVTFAWPAGAGDARLEVYDVSGARRWSATVPAGTHALTWDFADARGDRLAPGVYWARVERGDRVLTNRLVRIR